MVSLSRRRAALLLGAGAVAWNSGSRAAGSKRRVIDVHHHYFPPAFAQKRRADLLALPGVSPETVDWTPEKSLAAMDKNGVAAALLTVSGPSVWLPGDISGSRALARDANEYGAKLAKDYPGRFGFLAALPMPDVEGSLAEIAYAFDVLKADGVGILSNYDDKFLGNDVYKPVFEELNRRQAVVYVHPQVASTSTHLIPAPQYQMLEYPFSTTRTITSLLYGKVLVQMPGIRWIFSHGGGALPFVAGRIMGPEPKEGPSNAEKMAALKSLYFDTASVANKPAFAALMEFSPKSHILFGTDFPYTPMEGNYKGLKAMEALYKLTPAQSAGIEHGNAEALFPRFKA